MFGDEAAADDRIVGLQTPGGCGALRLGAELVARANPNARIFVGEPTWPNHAPLIASAGVEMVAYPYYDKDSRTICFERMMDALGEARGAATSSCCTAAATIRPAPISTWTSGARSPTSSPSAA